MPENSPFSNNISQPGTGENEKPAGGPSFAPPPSNVFIRTSDSDLNKLKSQGGEVGFNPPSPVSPPSSPSFAPPPPPPPPVSPSPSVPPASPIPPISSEERGPVSPTPISGGEKVSPGLSPEVAPKIPSEMSSNASAERPVSPNIPSGEMSISPEIPASELSSFSSSVSAPPSKRNKYLPFLIIGGVIIAGVAFGYFYLWPKLLKPKPAPVVTTTTVPPASTTTSTTLASSPYPQISGPYQKTSFPITVAGPTIVSAIKEAALAESTSASAETFKVLIPKIHNDALTGEEVILSLIPNLPQRLKPYLLGRKYMLYTYYGKVHPSLGLIVSIGKDNKENVKSIFAAWAKGAILNDLNNFFLVNTPKKAVRQFKETTNAGTEMHYFTYKGEEAAIVYAFFDQYLIISSSKESVNSAASHLQGITEPISP